MVTGWGDRMEHILRHSIFALLHLPGSTLLDIADILRSESKESETNRKLILEVVRNAEARRFWQHDFIRYRSDEFGPPKHKLSKLLVSESRPAGLFIYILMKHTVSSLIHWKMLSPRPGSMVSV